MKIIQVIDFSSFSGRWLNIALHTAPYADMLWFRIKNVPDDVLYSSAEILRDALPEVPMVLSGRADIASALKYDGVQLGLHTEKPSDVKLKFPELIIGYSAHSTEEILSVAADFYTLSPVFFTKKDYEVRPLGVIDVSGLNKTVYALGGINKQNCVQLKGMGYAGIAGISFYKELAEIRRIII